MPQTVWFQILAGQNGTTNNLSSSSYQDNRIKIDNSKETKIYQWNTNLVIRDVILEDSGKYLCVVSNSVGEDSIETDLLVRGKFFSAAAVNFFMCVFLHQNTL